MAVFLDFAFYFCIWLAGVFCLFAWFFVFMILIFFSVLRTKPKPLHLLGKPPATAEPTAFDILVVGNPLAWHQAHCGKTGDQNSQQCHNTVLGSSCTLLRHCDRMPVRVLQLVRTVESMESLEERAEGVTGYPGGRRL